ncbi:hypothetical protein [Pedobacter arcticus]|uniref:hypothetical protein n=1 Tax=Pedobacter arcticus TaxID=752140 RepID=UPI00036022AF|nr:hypothetical protein [Pedobacter arcticus]
MLQKTLLMIALCVVSYASKAQFMEYEPLPLPNQNSQPKENKAEVTIVNAYILNGENQPIKVKLKVTQSRYGIYVKAFKRLTDEYWLEYGNLSHQASKVYSGSELSKYFEYEVYIPSLQKKVYF